MTQTYQASDDYFRLKTLAFLHDPPQKALDIKNHEVSAEKYQEWMSDLDGAPMRELMEKLVKKADVWASICDRGQLPAGWARDFWVNEQLQFVHPLSGNPRLIETGGHEGNLIDKQVSEFLRTIWVACGELFKTQSSNPYHRYLRLFYLLKNGLMARGSKALELPADTRAPNHTIFSHMDLVAAFSGAIVDPLDITTSSNPCLVRIFSYGVQGFIEASRSSQDLWTSSYMLSSLMVQIASQVIRELGPDAILAPDIHHQQQLAFEVLKNDYSEIANELQRWFERQSGQQTARLDEGEILKWVDADQFFTPSLPNTLILLVPECWLLGAKQRLTQKVYQWFSEIASALMEFVTSHLPDLRNHISEELIVKTLKTHLRFDVVAARLPEARSTDDLQAYLKELTALGVEDEILKRDIQAADALPASLRYRGDYFTCYASASTHLAKLAEAQKLHRSFEQPHAEGKDKCSLSSEDEVLGPKSYRDCRDLWGKLQKNASAGFRLKTGEKLGTLGLVKRLYLPAYLKSLPKPEPKNFQDFHEHLDKFPSLEDISLAHFKVSILQHAQQDESTSDQIENFVREVNNLKSETNDDGFEDIYFKQRSLRVIRRGLTDHGRNFSNLGSSWFLPSKISKIKGSKKVREILKALKEREAQSDRPSGYLPFSQPGHSYAILHMDGDELSKWLGGQKGPGYVGRLHPDIRDRYRQEVEKHLGQKFTKLEASDFLNQSVISPAVHKAISEALANFSLVLVRKVVEDEFHGKLVYSGGDDVLALLAPEVVLACATRLQELFRKDFLSGANPSEQAITNMVMGKGASMSAGIVIAPLKYPFQIALSEARQAEKQAKNQGRDRFCLRVRRSGGEQFDFCETWQSPVFFDVSLEQKSFLKRFMSILDKTQKVHVSSRFPYRVFAELNFLATVGDSDLASDLFHNAMLRLASQHLNSKGLSKEEKQAGVSEVVTLCLEIWDQCTAAPNGCEKMADFLKLAVIMSRHQEGGAA